MLRMIFKPGDQVRHYLHNDEIFTVIDVRPYPKKDGYGRGVSLVTVTNSRDHFSCDDQFLTLVDSAVEQREAIAVLGEEYFA